MLLAALQRDFVIADVRDDLDRGAHVRKAIAAAGENLAVGEKLALRLFGGVRYANMNEHLQAFYFGGDFDPVQGARSNRDFGYWGVGPRVGAGGCRVAFVHPKATAGILLELTEF